MWIMQAYLDYAAATPMNEEVLAAQMPYFTELFYNPSASYSRAREIKSRMNAAKDALAHVLGTKRDSLVMVAGATEANNLICASVDGEIITSAIEHESILQCAKTHPHKLLQPTREGIITPEALREALNPRTELVTIELANGEIGAIQPIRALAKVIDDERTRRLKEGNLTPLIFHTDASQAAESVSLNISSLGVDAMTLSAAKIYGPKQVGLLYTSNRVHVRPLVLGGGQEANLRSGTENVAGTIAFAKALELACAYRTSPEEQKIHALRDFMQRELIARFPWAYVAGPKKDKLRLPHTLHISFPGIEARRLIILLEEQGVYAATGSACAASKMRISHVLQALGLDEYISQGSLRFTLGRPTTKEEITYAIACIERAVTEEMNRMHLTAQDIEQHLHNLSQDQS